MVRHNRKKNLKTWNQWIATIIMIVSTSIIVLNNVGQTFLLMQFPLSKVTVYWIAGLSLLAGIVWEAYLNKLIRLN